MTGDHRKRRSELGNLLRSPADAALAWTAQAFVNSKLRGIGELSDLQIETAQHSIRCRLMLIGESEPVEVVVRRYDVERRGDHTSVVIAEAASTRPWVDAVLTAFLVGRPLPVPASAAAVLAVLS